MPVTRVHYILLAAAAVLLLLGLARQHDEVRDTIKNAFNNQAPEAADPAPESPSVPPPQKPEKAEKPAKPAPQSEKLKTFHEIALKYGTDKVTDHQYWFMYDKYFPPIRQQKLKMLEIGLGCNMNYGPGKSYYTWLEYFPNVELYYMEYDAACAEKWATKTSGATIFTGDQADPVFLQKFIDEAGDNFDIIIDDGGHTMNQQMVSLEHLWKIVKPGGLYFIEDLQTSFWPTYGGDPSGGKDPKIATMAKYIYELIDDKLTPEGTRHKISADMRGIECQREVCVFTKKESGTL